MLTYPIPLPAPIRKMAETPVMLRLRGVGMNCGCEYTQFRRFLRLAPYSRYDHSLGVAHIVWQFTGDLRQTAAGLLHDVASPTFAHVVDFLHGDYLTQESTEAGTRELIDGCAPLQSILADCGLETEDVCDYHRYPIADNDAPRLSADRLEYTLGNLVNFELASEREALDLLAALTVGENETGEPELSFRSADAALRFADGALACSRIYVSDEDRFAMQMLAELLAAAIREGVVCYDDLMTDEPRLLKKLCREPVWRQRWEEFCAMSELERADKPVGEGWRRIDAKRRCIDPLIVGQGRTSACFPAFGEALKQFLCQPLDVWLRALL